MKNKIFEGLDLVKIAKDDPDYPNHSGCWALKDKRSGRVMPQCLSKHQYNISIMKQEAESVLQSPAEVLLNLYRNSWDWDHENYIYSLFLHKWVAVNPDAINLMEERLSAKIRAKMLREENRKGKRGRPPKNSTHKIGGKRRGRPPKNTSVVSYKEEAGVMAEPRKRGRPAKVKTDIVVNTVKSGRGRPPKAQTLAAVSSNVNTAVADMPTAPRKRGRPPKNR